MEAYESTPPMVECENLVKIYKTKDIEVLALQGLEVRIAKGELMAIIGNSGSGKSTFLNMIGGLDRPSAGRLIVDGKDLFKLSDRELVDYKRRTVGFVWQNNARNLVPYLTAWQNVQMPMLFDKGAQKKRRALELLEMVGLAHKKNSRAQLSAASAGRHKPARGARQAAAIGGRGADAARRLGRGSGGNSCAADGRSANRSDKVPVARAVRPGGQL